MEAVAVTEMERTLKLMRSPGSTTPLTTVAFALAVVALLVVLALLAAVITGRRRLRRSRRAPC